MAGFGHKHNVHKAYKPMAAQPQLDDDIVHPAMEQEINPGLTSAGEPISRVAPDINPANGGYVEDGQQADTSPGSGDAVGDRHVSLRDKVGGHEGKLAVQS